VYQWAWDVRTGTSFHNYLKYGKIIFE